ncbi:MAG: CehA/McbA family metallohydrolase [candidate division WS1 bacterium]|nr:CehA/McbA family metallohydrolase [candidate division WS1 bacterium]
MLSMNRDGDGRRADPEIRAEVLRRYNADLVEGFGEISEWARADRERQWVASFTDARCAYYIHQEGHHHLQFWTGPTPSETGAEQIIFVFSVGMGMGSMLPQPSGRFDIVLNVPPGITTHLVSFNVTKESRVWRNGDVTLAYDVKRQEWARGNAPMKLDAHITEESAATFGIMALRVPRKLIPEGKPARIDIVPFNRQPSRRWFKLDVDMFTRPIYKSHIEPALEAVTAGPTPPSVDDWNVYFGDLHVHTGEEHGSGRSCGTGTLEENYGYGRDVAGLDFIGIADHDWQFAGQEDWEGRMAQMDEWDEPGRYVVIPAYEWTSAKYGHRNVYYRGTGWPYFDNNPGPGHNAIGPDSRSPEDLWRSLRECGAKALTIAHHPSTGFFPVDWSYMDEEFDRLVEVYSTWGNSEYLGAPFSGTASDRLPGFGALDALKRGYRLGLMASSDGHDGNPGNAQWSNRQPHIHHRLGSGFIAVLADDLTRGSVWDAMHARRCYATTGTRIVLDFRVNGAIMGSEIEKPADDINLIEADVTGTAPVDRIELVRDGEVICSKPCSGMTETLRVEEGCPEEPCFYYLRVFQTDGEMAWSSPVWVG